MILRGKVILLCYISIVFVVINALIMDHAVEASVRKGKTRWRRGFWRRRSRQRENGVDLDFQIRNVRPRFLCNCVFPDIQCDPKFPYRTPDGTCNNIENPHWGAVGYPFKRILLPDYDDGVMSPRAHDKLKQPLPPVRTVSKMVHTPDTPATQDKTLTSMFTHFGQFLDHDLDLTPLADLSSALDCCDESIQFPSRGFYSRPKASPADFAHMRRPLAGTCYPIEITQPDRHFNRTCMNFIRSRAFAPTFQCNSATREQGNAVTSFIDASQVYGSTKAVQDSLRSFTNGQLASFREDLLPANTSTTCVSSTIRGKVCFGAGDQRVNEQPLLSTLHVVFHRFHNLVANFFAARHRLWDDERIFQESRKIVGAVLQSIVYNEYLPKLLGPSHMRAYGLSSQFMHRYEPTTDPRISNEFATAAFRFGHSMVPDHLKFGTQNRRLEDWFFCPHAIQDPRKSTIDHLLKGSLNDLSQQSDRFFAPAVSHKLFVNRGRGLDLASLNLQRGRDHGLPAYNEYRKVCGLPILDFQDVPGNPFSRIFRTMNDVDLFSGAMSEEHVTDGVVGPTFACLIARQFRDLKYGDRFWFENFNAPGAFTWGQINTIRKTTLASVLCAVTKIGQSQKRVFEPVSAQNSEIACNRMYDIDLSQWLDNSYF